MGTNAQVVYSRRRPEHSTLYKIVQQHWRTFAAAMEEAERGLPKYVVREFERYLDCGILARGFALVKCTHCQHTQRCSSHLALNPHFHSLVTDGVYVREEGSDKPDLPCPISAEQG